ALGREVAAREQQEGERGRRRHRREVGAEIAQARQARCPSPDRERAERRDHPERCQRGALQPADEALGSHCLFENFSIMARAKLAGEPYCARTSHIAPLISRPTMPLAPAFAARSCPFAPLRRRRPRLPAAKPTATPAASIPGEARPCIARRPVALLTYVSCPLRLAMRLSRRRISSSRLRCICRIASRFRAGSALRRAASAPGR